MDIREALTGSGLHMLDAEVLLAHVVGHGRSWLIAHGTDALSDAQSKHWHALQARRKTGEPVAYLTGTKEFYGRSFHVDPSVLIPRPATEGLIDVALQFLDQREPLRRTIDSGIIAVALLPSPSPTPTILDIGTGSGVIAITLALLRPALNIIATDSSSAALAIARQNACKHGVDERISFICESHCETITAMKRPFIIIANPPYIPANEPIDESVKDFEPHEALFAGENGLDVIDMIVRAAKGNPHCCGVVLECRDDQCGMMNEE